jgi:ABC-type uncharacterized transport system fused permease/ATPase subunit
MNTQADKTSENKSQTTANNLTRQKSQVEADFRFGSVRIMKNAENT